MQIEFTAWRFGYVMKDYFNTKLQRCNVPKCDLGFCKSVIFFEIFYLSVTISNKFVHVTQLYDQSIPVKKGDIESPYNKAKNKYLF